MVPGRSKTAHVSQFTGTLLVCHLERSEAPAERSRKTPLLFRSPEKLITISTTGRITRIVATPEPAKKVFRHPQLAPAAEAAADVAALTARLKPPSFKTRSKSRFFRNFSVASS